MDHNDTIPDTVIVLPSYTTNAITVTASILPCLLPNIFILFVGLKSGVIKDKFRDSIVTMTGGYLFTALVVLAFNSFYFIAHFANIPVNFYLCSGFRRFTAYSYTPMLYGCIIVSVDRFYAVCLNRAFNRIKIFILNIIFGFFPFAVFLSQMTSSEVKYEDVCGPTLYGHFMWMLDVNTALFIVYPVIAMVLNGSILYYLYHNSKRLIIAGRKLNAQEERKERNVVYGMLIQSILPLVCQIPMMICIMFFYKGQMPSSMLLLFANVFVHVNLTLNPIFTVIFVKQFRVACCKLIRSNKVIHLFVPSSLVLSGDSESPPPMFRTTN